MELKLPDVTIALLGGGLREEIMLDYLVATEATVKTLGQPKTKSCGIEACSEIAELVTAADVVLAPMTGVDQQGYLKATFAQQSLRLDEQFFAQLEPGTLFMIGIADNKLKSYCQEYSIELIQLAKLDELAIKNSIPTAEGAIQTAMEESEITLHSNNSIVLGLGRVGLTQARMLAGLGSKTYGAARKPGVRARAKELGIIPVKFEELADVISKMDFIFNTVPALVLDRKILKQVKSEALIIDLASAPGGTDFTAAEELGLKAKLTLGLPGQVAPKSAGEILGQIVPRLIKERI
ncbi:MAG: dipicolinate synthase subunit DpsA [Bacillota bacterium]